MNLPIEPSTKRKIWAVIWFLFAERVPAMDICHNLIAVYDENTSIMLVQMIRQWCLQFKAGWKSIYDEFRAGSLTKTDI